LKNVFQQLKKSVVSYVLGHRRRRG